MAKNLSKLYGVPVNKQRALQQHSELKRKLSQNEVFMFGSQNRGHLVLKKGSGQYKNAFYNVLYNKKPKGKFLKATRV